MKTVHTSDWRSFWSAVARYRFGSYLRLSQTSETIGAAGPGYPHSAGPPRDYPSGTELPHSKGHIYVAVFALAAFALSGVVIGKFFAGRANANTQTTRPNVLLIIADDWAYPHAGAYGDRLVKTPNFDRIAREGVLFTNAFCAAPSCTPSSASILTGRAVHQLEEGGNLHAFLPSKFDTYPDLLEAAGSVGYARKGWGPGRFEEGGRKRNPAGPLFKTFDEFYKQVPKDKPFCFCFGPNDPHRPYDKGTGAKSGMKAENVVVPAFLPDTPEVREDVLDYYFEVERMDRDAGEIIKAIEAAGQLDNTLIVWTADNGMPFPRAKANLYDGGSHVPLAIRWPVKSKGGRTLSDFVVLTDVAPMGSLPILRQPGKVTPL